MNTAARLLLLLGGGAAIYYAYRNRASLAQTLSPVVNLIPPTTPNLTPICRNEAGDVVPCSDTGAIVTPPVNVTPTPEPITPAPQPVLPAVGSGPRGIRNNNPGNIVYNPANNWTGQTGSDGHFAIFSSMPYGIRALFLILKTYVSRGWNTPALIAAHWAPSSENNTAAYAQTVSAVSGIGLNTPVQATFTDLSRIARGIITAENGASFTGVFSDAILLMGWVLT